MRTTIVLATAALVSLAYHVNSTKLMGIDDSRAITCTYTFTIILFWMGFVGWLQARRGSQTRWLIWACLAALFHAGLCLMLGWLVSSPDCFEGDKPVRCGEPSTTPQILLGCLGLWVIAGLSAIGVRIIAGPTTQRNGGR